MCQAFEIKINNSEWWLVNDIGTLINFLCFYPWIKNGDVIHHAYSDNPNSEFAISLFKNEDHCLCPIDLKELLGRIISYHVGNMDSIEIHGL